MRTVPYKTLLDGALLMRGEDPDQANVAARRAMGEYLDQALSACHEHWRWPELVTIEERNFRELYVSTQQYQAGAEVYLPLTRKYYQALRSSSGQSPVSLFQGNPNLDYWAELVAEVSGPDWQRFTDYAKGDIVRRLDNGRYYMCHTAHTSTASFATGNFGLLASWRPYIAYAQPGYTEIESVIEVYDADPRSNIGALKVPYRIDAEGVRFAADQAGPLWVEYRRACPKYAWTSEWSEQSYAAGSIVYHLATGEVYRATSAVTASDVPGTAAAWQLQQVPHIFRHAAKYKAYALWLDGPAGKTEAALIFDNPDPANPGKFQHELDEQVWQYTKLQGQTGRVRTAR